MRLVRWTIMEKAKDVLMKIEEGITPIYAKRTGLSDEKITELLEAETWMLADKAVELVSLMRCPDTREAKVR